MKKESIYFVRIIWQLFTSHPITPTSFHMCSHARISTRKVNIIGTEGQHWGYTCCDNQGSLAHPNADFSQYSFSGGDHTSPEIVSPSSPSLTPLSPSLPHSHTQFSIFQTHPLVPDFGTLLLHQVPKVPGYSAFLFPPPFVGSHEIIDLHKCHV